MTKASQFEVGTIVKLKSGGPEMTIQSFSNDGVYTANGSLARSLRPGNFLWNLLN